MIGGLSAIGDGVQSVFVVQLGRDGRRQLLNQIRMQIGNATRDNVYNDHTHTFLQQTRTFPHERLPVRRAVFVRGTDEFDRTDQFERSLLLRNVDFKCVDAAKVDGNSDRRLWQR